jgi:single-stranded-DNA-specific exonuclease
LADAVTAARRDDTLRIDAALSASAANPETMALIARAGPFGAGNAEPIVAFPHHTLVYADPVGQNHIRVRLKGGDGGFVNAIAFRSVGQKLGNALLQSRGRAVHVAGCLALDRWQGEERVQLRILDMAAADGFPP